LFWTKKIMAQTPNMSSSRGASALLQLILSAALFFANAVGHSHPHSSFLVSCGAVHSRLSATPLRLRGGCDSGAAGLEERMKALISRAPVMLFMKGEPDAPQCGFSRCAVWDSACPARRRSREQHLLVFARAHSLTQPIATCVHAGRL